MDRSQSPQASGSTGIGGDGFFFPITDADDAAFRSDIAARLDRCLGLPNGTDQRRLPDFGVGAMADDLSTGRDLLAALAREGLATPLWPAHLGGVQFQPRQAVILTDELKRRGVGSLYAYAVGLNQVGPAIIRHGSPAQQGRWLPAIATGQEIWCQLFSEPDAGSDLANVRTRAKLDPSTNEWVVSGQKVWSSRAAYADWGFLVARTQHAADRHDGLSVFGLPMKQPGVDVRPIRQMNGDEHFAEVFLTEARTAAANLIGTQDEGWRVAITTLMHERAGAGSMVGLSSRAVVALARNAATYDDALADRTVQVVMALEIDRLTSIRLRQGSTRSTGPGPEGAIAKIRGADTLQLAADVVFDLLGASANATASDWEPLLLTAPSMSIRGGTNEVLLNTIGERVLGLEREPRPGSA